jgi:hypothetical protein
VRKITILRQKIIFFPMAEAGAKNVGVFRVKNHDFTPKNLIFSNFRGARAGCAPPSGSAPETKDYAIGICCFSDKHAALKRKSKDWSARNQNYVSELSDMFTSGLLFQ